MDIFCSKCGEPWEMNTLHDIASESQKNFHWAAGEFVKYGCGAFEAFAHTKAACTLDPVVSPDELAAIEAVHELSDYPDEWDYELGKSIFL